MHGAKQLDIISLDSSFTRNDKIIITVIMITMIIILTLILILKRIRIRILTLTITTLILIPILIIAGLPRARSARGTEPHTHGIWSTSFLLVVT